MDVFVHAMVVRNLDAVSRVKSEVADPILNPSPYPFTLTPTFHPNPRPLT